MPLLWDVDADFWLTGRKGADNDAFFRANKSSKWYVVAGNDWHFHFWCHLVSVPGMVRNLDMTYMQMVLGFFFGYLVIAFILLPLYYRLNLTTIYGYLEQRYGVRSYKTEPGFSCSPRLWVLPQDFTLWLTSCNLWCSKPGRPFVVTVICIILIIWLYSHKSGIKTIIWTDWLQTLLFITALVLIIWQLSSSMGMNLAEIVSTIRESPHSRIFIFDDWHSTQHFVKQFFSGMFITIVMTGLDSGSDAEESDNPYLARCSEKCSLLRTDFAPINFLFLSLGVLLLAYAGQNGILCRRYLTIYCH